MNMHRTGSTLATLLGAALAFVSPFAGAEEPAPDDAASKRARGKYLVTIAGCNDCHTPLAMGPDGPGPDMSRMLSGHPESLVMPPVPKLPEGPWGAVVANTFTAWSGPWGVSFTANLTPDPETGLGRWTVDTFIATMKTGRHEGKGRPLLPPMPYPSVAALTDEDIRALFAYLQSLPPIRNRVPTPVDPEDQR